MPDPDLEIREEEGWGGGGRQSRPGDKGAARCPIFFFQPFAPQFGHGFLVWSKNKGAPPPAPSPGSATANN